MIIHMQMQYNRGSNLNLRQGWYHLIICCIAIENAHLVRWFTIKDGDFP